MNLPDIALPAAYAMAVSAAGQRDAVAFRERATAFVDRYPSHEYTELLLYRLVGQAVERREPEQAEAWTRRLVRDRPASELITDAWLLLAEGSGRDRPALARQAYGEILARVREPEMRSAAWLGLAVNRAVDTPFFLGTAGMILVVSLIETWHGMAYGDELTGLPARRALDEAVEERS